MRIILTEILGNQRLQSHEFRQPNIKVGRDPVKCEIAFEQQKWLMVSRVHAEFRFVNGQYCVVDLNSRQGTLLNGKPVSAPTIVQPGARIQFGDSGPMLQVDAINDLSLDGVDLAVSTKVSRPSVASSRPLPTNHSLKPTGFTSQVPVLILESGTAVQGAARFLLTKETTVLGRDSAADIQVDAAASVVSRRHAEIKRQPDGNFIVSDLKSFNGTRVNGQRISKPTVLKNDDVLQLSTAGPILRFVLTREPSPTESRPVIDPISGVLSKEKDLMDEIGSRTLVARAGVSTRGLAQKPADVLSQPVIQHAFDAKGKVAVGRAADNDIQLDALQISNHHARFINTAQGIIVQDAGSTNGIFLNGTRVAGWCQLDSDDVVQIGPFVLTADLVKGVSVFDTRSQTQLDALGITHIVSVRGEQIKLLDDISLSIAPNEFVGLLGPSGAGKSLLMNALIGMHKPDSGRVLINNLDLYHHLPFLKQAIGHVPQDDIIHRELTVYQTLFYVARLRLSRDVNSSEIDQIINEVLEVTGLAERRQVQVSQLSGGQRKRVSIAVELITKPSLIFLDEPTSGLDPAIESRIMQLFRQIAESGRTVILTTHAMENVHLFDKVALLMRGRLVFYGTPQAALEFVGVDNFAGLYSQLEQPMEKEQSKLTNPTGKASTTQVRTFDKQRNDIADRVADQWRQKFATTPAYQENVAVPLSRIQQGTAKVPAGFRRQGILDSIWQVATLVRRYARVLLSDKINLAILFGQAPIIGFLTYLVVAKDDPRDFPYFVLALVPLWFGISVAARELVKERSIYRRERMVNLSLLPYVGSKLLTLSWIVCLQCLMLFLTLKTLHFLGVMYLPGFLGGAPHLIVMVLTGTVGIALGLLVSALVRTSEIATSIVPLLLIPQILFCGLVGVPNGVARVVSTVMPATWAFDELKQTSTLDTLRREGSNPEGTNEGRGLFKNTERVNDQRLKDARQQAESQRKKTESDLKDYERRMKEYLNAVGGGHATTAGSPPQLPPLGPAPAFPEIQKVGDDLSHYISFKHPWGGIVTDFVVLIVMFCMLLVLTLIVLRTRDIKL